MPFCKEHPERKLRPNATECNICKSLATRARTKANKQAVADMRMSLFHNRASGIYNLCEELAEILVANNVKVGSRFYNWVLQTVAGKMDYAKDAFLDELNELIPLGGGEQLADAADTETIRMESDACIEADAAAAVNELLDAAEREADERHDVVLKAAMFKANRIIADANTDRFKFLHGESEVVREGVEVTGWFRPTEEQAGGQFLRDTVSGKSALLPWHFGKPPVVKMNMDEVPEVKLPK